MDKIPWGTNRLRRLGECIRDEAEVPDGLPTYADIEAWFNDLAAETQSRIEAHDWARIVGDSVIGVTSRAKTIDTLRQKLRRDRATPLQSIQDIAGVRVEARMRLDTQDVVASEIARMFDCPHSAIHDLRDRPHSGYRAMHVWLRMPAGRVEVQVRTHLQGAWANLYEAVADVLGREIRYGRVPEDPESAEFVSILQGISVESISRGEKDGTVLALKRADLARRLEDETIDESQRTMTRQMLAQTVKKIAAADRAERDVVSSLEGLTQRFREMRRRM